MTTELIPIFTGEIAGQLVPVFNARDWLSAVPKEHPAGLFNAREVLHENQ